MLGVRKFVGLLVESLADQLHELEAERLQLILKECTENSDGSFTIPAGLVQEIIDLSSTPYVRLGEEYQLYYKHSALTLTSTFESLIELVTVGGTHIKNTDKYFGAFN